VEPLKGREEKEGSRKDGKERKGREVRIHFMRDFGQVCLPFGLFFQVAEIS
jgi:hypothetical protein